MMARYSLKKTERLTGKKNIEQLFLSGEIFRVKPFKVFLQIVEQQQTTSGSQFLISVPKKIHKTSVVRNLIKRRIRESYRLNKGPLIDFLTKSNITIHWGVIYLTDKIQLSQTIEEKMVLILQQLIQSIENRNKNGENNK